jgi:hypothetical protein
MFGAEGWEVEADRQGYVELGYDWVMWTIMTVHLSIPGFSGSTLLKLPFFFFLSFHRRLFNRARIVILISRLPSRAH